MRPNSQEYKDGAKAYRNGFLLGAFIGIVICLFLQKAIWTLPLVLGLLSGAIAINRKI
jgi:VIT1/CCC1 family predicted Fe2+/Mn2+ transporter